MPTPTHLLLDQLLGDQGPLERFVADRRATGMAWRLISRDIEVATKIDVTYETLRSWFPDLAKAAS